ncbi:hypothetical protein C8J57DRAFT_1241486 [Mycena rebaudengoi]|nr:hypothetical protein C8J57DRAFT_1241486 [Mycena rebaudengoi]
MQSFLGLCAVPSTGTAVVSTGPGRERSVTRRPSFRQLKLLSLPVHEICPAKGLYIAYDQVWRVFWTRRPVDGRFRRARPSKTQSKSATERVGYPSHGTRRTGVTGTAHSPKAFRSNLLTYYYIGDVHLPPQLLGREFWCHLGVTFKP